MNVLLVIVGCNDHYDFIYEVNMEHSSKLSLIDFIFVPYVIIAD